MSSSQESPQLPPTSAITPKNPLKATTEKWFEYSLRVQPHHTDYAGVVWHGTYVSWLETARVECLRSMGIDFAELVKLGCELPVVELGDFQEKVSHPFSESDCRTSQISEK